MGRVVVTGLGLHLAVEALHAASHGVGVVDVDVVVVPIAGLLHKRLGDAHACVRGQFVPERGKLEYAQEYQLLERQQRLAAHARQSGRSTVTSTAMEFCQATPAVLVFKRLSRVPHTAA